MQKTTSGKKSMAINNIDAHCESCKCDTQKTVINPHPEDTDDHCGTCVCNKVIIDLCGGTGSWSKPFADAGFEVHIITLPELSIADWWLVDGALRFRRQVAKSDGGLYLEIPVDRIYGVLAAPPCTMFSLARTTAKMPRDLIGGMSTVRNCLDIIYAIQESRHFLKFWAMENPRGHLRKFMGTPPYSFKQWQFDTEANHEKPTDIWGNFKEPKPIVKTKPTFAERDQRALNWQNPNTPEEYKHMKLDRVARRAITPKGFAEAFYRANK